MFKEKTSGMTERRDLPASDATQKRHSVRIVIGTLIVLVVLGVIGFAPRFWRERQLRATVYEVESSARVVTVALPARASPASDLVLPGSIQAVQETAIYARVDGYLKRRLVNIGDRVRSGDILAEIDTPELNQQFYQAKAALAQAVSALEQARAALQHNESQLDYNRTTLERWRTMKGQRSRGAARRR